MPLPSWVLLWPPLAVVVAISGSTALSLPFAVGSVVLRSPVTRWVSFYVCTWMCVRTVERVHPWELLLVFLRFLRVCSLSVVNLFALLGAYRRPWGRERLQAPQDLLPLFLLVFVELSLDCVLTDTDGPLQVVAHALLLQSLDRVDELSGLVACCAI